MKHVHAQLFLSLGQTAIGVPGACEVIGHGLRVTNDLAEGQVGASFDGSNAFNLTNRTLILRGLTKHAPELIPFYKACYGIPALMYFYIGKGIAPLWAEEGVAQGDTLGLLYFCIAQAEVTEATKDARAEEGIMIGLPALIRRQRFHPADSFPSQLL